MADEATSSAPASAPAAHQAHCCCRVLPGQEHIKLRWEIHPKVRQLSLVTSDGKEFLVDEDAAFQSNLLRKMVDNLSGLNGGAEEDTDNNQVLKESLPLTTITSAVLEKILEWCYDHRKEK